MSALSSNPSPEKSPWLFGPAIDLLFGCGLIYAVIVGFLFLLQPKMSQLGPWLPIVILFTGMPHYGATLLRINATPDDRRRYLRPAILLSVIAASLLCAGLSIPRLGALIITLYLTFSPWHYTAQNYGITMLFLRRRGIPLSISLRRLLRLSFVTSFLLVVLSYHQTGAGGGNDPLYAASAAFRFLPLGIPMRVIRVATPILFALHGLALLLTLRILFRNNRPRALLPMLTLLFSQSVWFSVPAVVSLLFPGRYPGNQLALAFVWIAVGHCVQYLWISTYFHRAAAGSPNADPRKIGRQVTLWYWSRVLFVGAAVWVVPALLLQPRQFEQSVTFGHVPFDAGLGLLIAAAVNLHHFALDGMIWRLREPRVGALLVDGPRESPPAVRFARRSRSAPPAPPTLATWALFVIGGASIFVWICAAWEREIGHRRAYAAKDVARLLQASARLAALGRDGPGIHIAIAKLEVRQGQLDDAAAEYRRSLSLLPTAAAWRGLGRIHQARGEYADAEAAYRAAESLESDAEDAR